MKAITYDRYGGTDRLRVDDVPEPRIGKDEVPAAIDHFASGSVVGKLVIRVWTECAA